MHRVPVREIMSQNPITCAPDLPVDVALETMTSNNVRRLPVVTRTAHVAGIITRYDAMLAMKRERDVFGQLVDEMPIVRDVMTANVITIKANESIARAARLMLNHKVGGLPVLNDENKLVGIVTESDLFRYIAEQLEPEEAAG
jgi:CBS domain-containing protein